MFKYLNRNPYGANIDDCVIRAISLALDIDYMQVFDDLCKIADELDSEVDRSDVFIKYLKSKNWEYYEPKLDMTVKKLTDLSNDPALIVVNGHMTFVKDGNTYDTWNPNRYKVKYLFLNDNEE